MFVVVESAISSQWWVGVVVHWWVGVVVESAISSQWWVGVVVRLHSMVQSVIWSL